MLKQLQLSGAGPLGARAREAVGPWRAREPVKPSGPVGPWAREAAGPLAKARVP